MERCLESSTTWRSPFARSGYAWARLAAVVAGLLAVLGFAAERANAGYSARVNNGTLTLTGNGASDQLALRLQAGVPTTLQVDVGDNGSADLSFDRAAFDRIVVNAGGGNDRVRMDEANGVFTDTETTSTNGQNGYDTLLGGAGAETFLGGAQNDRVDGNGGADIGLLGTGHDTFVWDPGDGSDIVEGQGGTDTLLFNGSGGRELRLPPTATAFASSATSATSPWTPTTSNGRPRSARRRRQRGRQRPHRHRRRAGEHRPRRRPRRRRRRRTARHHHRHGTAGADDINVTSASGRSRSTASPRTCTSGGPSRKRPLAIDGRGGGDLVKVFGSAAGDVIDIALPPVAGNARVTASNIPAFVDVAGVARSPSRASTAGTPFRVRPGLATLLTPGSSAASTTTR